jgi:uncharacterized phage protein gp47/JayE
MRRMSAWLLGAARGKISDLVPGSVLRSLLESVAVEQEAQDVKTYQAIKKGIAVGVYQTFGFDLLPGASATTTVIFSVDAPALQDIVVPAGTVVSTVQDGNGVAFEFQTTYEDFIPTGQTSIEIGVMALKAGAASNVAANSITVLKSSVSSVSAVNNLTAASGGADTETESARQLRFNAYIQGLARSTTDGIRAGAMTVSYDHGSGNIEQVVDAYVTEPSNPALPTDPALGEIHVAVYNGGSSPETTELKAQVAKILNGYTETGTRYPGYKAAGIVLTVYGVTRQTQNVSVTVDYIAGYNPTTVSDAVTSVITTYFATLSVGDGFILNELVERIMSVDGVKDLQFVTPTANVTVDGKTVLKAGTITVSLTEV